MNFNDAHAWCQDNNGQLPTPTSSAENDFLRGLGSTYLAFDVSQASDLSYTNWHAGEPSGDGSAIVLIDIAKWTGDNWNGKWNDMPADETDAEYLYGSTCYISKGN